MDVSFGYSPTVIILRQATLNTTRIRIFGINLYPILTFPHATPLDVPFSPLSFARAPLVFPPHFSVVRSGHCNRINQFFLHVFEVTVLLSLQFVSLNIR